MQNSNQNQSTNSFAKSVPANVGPQANKKGFIEYSGTVDELLPGAKFAVTLDNGHKIIAHLSGKMRMNHIKLLPSDKVKVEMSTYD